MRFILLLLVLPFLTLAQTVDVPDEMVFLETKIHIKNSAKDKIAESIAVLKKHKGYYQTKLDRIDAYFPIVERVFAREGVPEDFKFLVVQESSLVSDAVSTSNAVGFWQFKRESAMELGLRVDDLVDDRKNISASTKGAAAYFKRSNAVFDNWIYTLQSYQVGLGGTQRSVDPQYYGAKEMDIDGDTYWYILKCIAHKLAFGEEEGKNSTPPLVLLEYGNCKGKTWNDLAEELQVEEGKLREYNKWLNHHTVPDDKDYYVTVPVGYMEKEAMVTKIGELSKYTLAEDIKPFIGKAKVNPKAEEMYPGLTPVFVMHNGLRAIQAQKGDDINKLAIQAGISRKRFLRYNDLRVFEEVSPKEYYYVEMKKHKSEVLFHVAKLGETLRDISQKYGVTVSAILNKNRMKRNEPLQPGRELWLKNKRPKEVAIKIVPLPTPVIKKPEPKPEMAPVVKDTTRILPKPVLTISTTQVQEVATTPPLPRIYFKDTTHIVQQGQTVSYIARLYNTRPDSIKAWNAIDSTGLKVSQVLYVKKRVVEPLPGFLVHTVAPGETMYRISDLYKVPVQKIQEWNNKPDFTLSTGDILFIKK
jgi:membrane-bound lytic murein transglycosylase D